MAWPQLVAVAPLYSLGTDLDCGLEGLALRKLRLSKGLPALAGPLTALFPSPSDHLNQNSLLPTCTALPVPGNLRLPDSQGWSPTPEAPHHSSVPPAECEFVPPAECEFQEILEFQGYSESSMRDLAIYLCPNYLHERCRHRHETPPETRVGAQLLQPVVQGQGFILEHLVTECLCVLSPTPVPWTISLLL